jgi:hypothetical protein
MNPAFSSSARCIAVAALFWLGCSSDLGNGPTGTGGAAGGSAGTIGNGGAAGTLSNGGTMGSAGTTGSAGVTGFGGGGGTAGTFGPIQCGFPEATRCPTCGNGVRDTCNVSVPADCDMRFTEWCDGNDLGTASCASLGLGSGTLRCTSDCGFDTSGCSGAQGGQGGGAGGTGGGVACDPQPPPSFTMNYVTDPGFENGASGGWGISGVNGFEVTTSAFHCGTHSGKRTARNYATDGFSYSGLQSLQGPFKFSLWVLQNGASNLSISADAVGVCGDSTTGFGYVSQTIAPNQWTRLAGTGTVGFGCTVSAFLITQASGTQLPDLFIDDVYVVQ